MHTTGLRKHFSIVDFLILGISLILLLSAGLIHSKFPKPSITISKQDSALNINQHFLTFMSIGNKRMLADLIWIQTLLESDLEHYSKNDLSSWMYLRFRAIAELDPKFYENYLFGGQLLSIAKDDLLGAEQIFSLGLKHYPDDYHLNYYSGFNLYFELGNFQEGHERLKKIANHPKANWNLKFLVNKLNFENTNNFDIAIDFLKMHIESSHDEFITSKLKNDLYALKAQRDLKCLNSGNGNCEMFDSEGSRYIYKDGKWKSLKNFVDFRIHKKTN